MRCFGLPTTSSAISKPPHCVSCELLAVEDNVSAYNTFQRPLLHGRSDLLSPRSSAVIFSCIVATLFCRPIMASWREAVESLNSRVKELSAMPTLCASVKSASISSGANDSPLAFGPQTSAPTNTARAIIGNATAPCNSEVVESCKCKGFPRARRATIPESFSERRRVPLSVADTNRSRHA